jgi:hypothetical protein
MLILAANGIYYRIDQFETFEITVNGSQGTYNVLAGGIALAEGIAQDEATALLTSIVTYLGVIPITVPTS